MDLIGLREYQLGDDVRYIDWNVTARMDVPYVRRYAEDRDLTAWFLLDLSPSVDFGTLDSARVKRTVLIDFVTTLARLLTRRGNRVGAILYDTTSQRTIPAGSGRLQVLRLVDELMREPTPASRPHDRPLAAPPVRRAGLQAPFAGLRDLRLHLPAGLGAPARQPEPAPRGDRRPPPATRARCACPTWGR